MMSPVGKKEMVSCLQREIAHREKIYPIQVANGMMTQAKAEREIHVMQGVLRVIEVMSDA